MKNEELTNKINELLETLKKTTCKDSPSEEQKRKDLKEFANHIVEDCDDKTTQCALYASNNGIGISGETFELLALLTSLIEYFIERKIATSEQIVDLIKMAVETTNAKEEGTFEDYFEQKLEEMLDKVEEAFKN